MNFMFNIYSLYRYICLCLFASSKGQPNSFLFMNQQRCYSRQIKTLSIKLPEEGDSERYNYLSPLEMHVYMLLKIFSLIKYYTLIFL